MKKGSILRTTKEVKNQYYDPIPKDSILRIDIYNENLYIEVSVLTPPTMTISFSCLRKDDSPYFYDFIKNIVEV